MLIKVGNTLIETGNITKVDRNIHTEVINGESLEKSSSNTTIYFPNSTEERTDQVCFSGAGGKALWDFLCNQALDIMNPGKI